MVDPLVTPATIAIAWIAKEGVGKLLGPSFEYMGDGLKNMIQKRNETTEIIVDNAILKLGPKLEEPGHVPPKILNTILNDGSFVTDQLAMEYFGGVLASSRTELGRDDRGDRMAKLVANLSTYQLRAHYLFYATIAHLFRGQSEEFGHGDVRKSLEIFIPNSEFLKDMDLTPDEEKNPQIMTHILTGLVNDGLIEHVSQDEDLNGIKRIFNNAPCGGIICSPSTQGVELFLWAHGQGDKHINDILSSSLDAKFDNMPNHVENSISTRTV